MSTDAKCSSCCHAIWDTVWGEYKCNKKQRTCNESELAMGCDNYEKLGTKPGDPKPEIVVRSGATFTPHVSDDAVLSWTNDKGLPNPDPVKLTEGLNGKDGKDGAPGKDGYTPVKGVDYFDGEDGKDGTNGKDGYTPVKGVDYFDGKDGKDGDPGKDGYTPVKGVDYFDGKDGAPGKDGKDGIDGVSPIVSVENISGGHRVTITDKYGKKTFNVMDGKDGEGGSGTGGNATIIDVLELPSDNINENSFYRLMTAYFVCNREKVDNGSVVHCVNTLPETGDIVVDATMSYFIAYYNVTDNDVYGYVDTALGSAFGVPAGWYPFTALASIANVGFNGVITHIEDDPLNGYFAVLLSYDYYLYKNGWCLIPFAYEKVPAFDIQWDGDMTDKFSLDMSLLGYDAGIYFTKVSDHVISISQAVGCTVYDNQDSSDVISDDSIDTSSFVGAFVIFDRVVIVHSEDELNTALGLPLGTLTNGIYFLTNIDINYHVTRLVAPSKITKIDERFLPDKSIDISSLGLHSVATSGNYNDLWNRPTIYTDVIRYNASQNLSSFSKQTARNNIDVYSRSEVEGRIEGEVDKLQIIIRQEYSKTTEVETMIANAIGSAIGGSY